MCGRISRDLSYEELIELYERGEIAHPDDWVRRRGPDDPFDAPFDDWRDLSRVQVAPTQDLAVTVRGGALRRMRWGFCPSWFERLDARGRPHINVRAETIDEKRTFRGAFRAGRFGLVWVTGWFEWQAGPTGKRPHLIQRPGAAPFALAGLWETWPGPAGPVDTVAIITTAASTDLSAIHARMPFALHPSAYRAWLAGQVRPEPAPIGTFEAAPVTARIGRADYQGRDALVPIEGE